MSEKPCWWYIRDFNTWRQYSFLINNESQYMQSACIPFSFNSQFPGYCKCTFVICTEQWNVPWWMLFGAHKFMQQLHLLTFCSSTLHFKVWKQRRPCDDYARPLRLHATVCNVKNRLVSFVFIIVNGENWKIMDCKRLN